MVHLIPFEVSSQRNRMPSFVDHHRIVVIKGVVHKDCRTAEIGADGVAAPAAAVKVDAWNGIESHRDAFDGRKPWVQTGRIRELVSALRIAVKQMIVTPGEANAQGIQHRGTENMRFRNGRQYITSHLETGEGLWRQQKVLIGAAALIFREAAKHAVLLRKLLVHPHDAVKGQRVWPLHERSERPQDRKSTRLNSSH